ncbi:FecR family protein [Hymenobacter latericus]|uniref:FecR family protein n=1 Tax=Hymenobacter sp. YIM 151858-1 TaxID=2987688 RepID=UPI0022264C94|nr:FecR domain-containing protein [Hymenobacter sp. YIM 151858-1]UYZ58777.1 FecR domain-containing protein [Hymenobacter sp. YIM 151858-1]
MPDLYPDTEAPWELLAKHLAGEASVSEQEELHRWLMARPSRLRVLTDATRAWERGGTTAEVFTEADVDKAWRRFSAAAGIKTTGGSTVAPPAPAEEARVVSMWGSSQTWMRVAAAVLLLVGAWAVARTFLLSRNAAETVTVAAGPERKLSTLPDGSRVWVNRNSTLSYAADFNENSRVVQLKGEAFFEVKKDNGRPFTVLANDTRTRVLGTSFNVRAYSAEDSVEVSVVTGRVAFSPDRQKVTVQDSVVLTPGLRGVIRRSAPAVAVQKPIIDPNFRAWQQDELVFDNQSLGQVAQALTRFYGTPVELSRPELANCRFTGTFKQAQLPQVLRVVSLSANLSVSQSADGYTLDGPGCQ